MVTDAQRKRIYDLFPSATPVDRAGIVRDEIGLDANVVPGNRLSTGDDLHRHMRREPTHVRAYAGFFGYYRVTMCNGYKWPEYFARGTTSKKLKEDGFSVVRWWLGVKVVCLLVHLALVAAVIVALYYHLPQTQAFSERHPGLALLGVFYALFVFSLLPFSKPFWR